MKLELQRDPFQLRGTTGRLFVDGKEFCFTLEPPKGATITDGRVCIPAGEYEIRIDYSPRFQRDMPRVLNVPGREGILLHWGNYVENTDGCILVGSSKSMIQGAVLEPAVWNSRETFDRLYQSIGAAQAGSAVLTVRNAAVISNDREIAVLAQLTPVSEGP